MSESEEDKTAKGLDIFHNYAATKSFRNAQDEKLFRDASRLLGMTNREHHKNAKSYIHNVTRDTPIQSLLTKYAPTQVVIPFVNEDRSQLLITSREKNGWADSNGILPRTVQANVFDIDSRKKLATTDLVKTPKRERYPLQYVMSPNAEYHLYQSDQDVTIYRQPINNNSTPIKSLPWIYQSFSAFTFSNDSSLLVGTATRYNVQDSRIHLLTTIVNLKTLETFTIDDKTMIQTVPAQALFSPDNTRVIITNGKKISVWNISVKDKSYTRMKTLEIVKPNVYADLRMAIDHTGRYLFTYDKYGKMYVNIYDLITYKLVHTINVPYKVVNIVSIPNKPMFVVITNEAVFLWDVGHMFFYQSTNGGTVSTETYEYKKRVYRVRTGTKGGKYILVGKDKTKIYINQTKLQ